MKAQLATLVLVAACGGSGSEPNSTADGNTSTDGAKAGIDAPSSVTITVTGTAAERGSGSSSTPIAGLAVSVYKSSDETTPVGMAMTDAQGKYTITVTAPGPFEGFVKGSKSGYVDAYDYSDAPLSGNTPADLNMITPSNFNLLSTFAGGNQQASKGLIVLAVLDASMNPVAGAKVSSTPASSPYRYNGSSGIPDQNAMSTGADGAAFMFNVPATQAVTVTAMKTGMTFKSHSLKAHAGAFTLTFVRPQ
ncbi:MAG: hypothetical protein JWO36_4298 [Myxococcales bacterium]|nr:hypothetical protein [Myxococcales bacterium]